METPAAAAISSVKNNSAKKEGNAMSFEVKVGNVKIGGGNGYIASATITYGE